MTKQENEAAIKTMLKNFLCEEGHHNWETVEGRDKCRWCGAVKPNAI